MSLRRALFTLLVLSGNLVKYIKGQGRWRMMLRKFAGSLLAVLLVFSLSTAAFAADSYPRTSGWDYVGSESWRIDGLSHTGKIFYSTGGDIKISINGHKPTNGDYTGKTLTVSLYESDGATSQLVKTFTAVPNGTAITLTYTGASTWVDGTDGTAEFYCKYSSNYATLLTVPVTYYD
jgi:hypothetical protein